MEKVKPGGVSRDNTGPVKISLFDQGNDEEANLRCDEGEEGEKAVSCRILPSSHLCQGGDDEMFNSANNNQAEGWTRFAISSSNDHNPCHTFLQSTNSRDIISLDGGEQGMIISGAFVEGSSGDGDDDGGGNNASTEENRGESEPKKRAVRADWYSFFFRGTVYHIKMNSSLGETYQSLATKAEQRNFMIENGEAEPYICGSRVRAAR
ncbi:hypothetical protein INS49_010857 [Diaporthe citri]|uniref:uncharacterized protein n=1 Tax=Diaporthe citri TaxID=83186 RepID=UPI001C7F990A|nr:uncharacterized protein INS49_010857 [Diaporthe citri]KAG6359804.1 hypothetical protein INS49_010857 [Diaporthe citri]